MHFCTGISLATHLAVVIIYFNLVVLSLLVALSTFIPIAAHVYIQNLHPPLDTLFVVRAYSNFVVLSFFDALSTLMPITAYIHMGINIINHTLLMVYFTFAVLT